MALTRRHPARRQTRRGRARHAPRRPAASEGRVGSSRAASPVLRLRERFRRGVDGRRRSSFRWWCGRRWWVRFRRAGSGRSTRRMSSVGGRAAAGAYAYATGDRATLGRLGLNYDDLRALGDPFEVTRQIVGAVCGPRASSTLEDAEERYVAAAVADYVLAQSVEGSPPDLDDVARYAIAAIMTEVLSSELGAALNERPDQVIAVAESELREAAKVLASQATLTATGPTENELSAAHREWHRDAQGDLRRLEMTSYTMRLATRSANTREDPSATFYWPMTGPSSFLAPFGPRLGSLGPVSQPNIDLVRLALLVFAADRSTPRAIGNTSWSVLVRDHCARCRREDVDACR